MYRHHIVGILALMVALTGLASTATAQAELSKAEQAAAVSLAARTKYKEGNYKTCAAMYREAFTMDPAQVGYLYSAALCAQKAGNLEAAQRDYQKVLGLQKSDDPYAAKARKHIGEVRAALIAKQRADAARRRAEWQRKQAAAKAERKRKAAAAAAAARKRAADAKKGATARPSWYRPVGWGSVGVGIVAAGLGGWLLVDGMSAVETLQGQLDDTDAHGKIVGIHRDQALTDEAAARDQQKLGGGILAAGVVVAAVGTYLLQPAAPAKTPRRATLAPAAGGRGLIYTLRF